MTDADVDGAHIRTLLLTFFHRQMPEIIRAGHLFIAQPPLYKIQKGKSEVNLKDQPAYDRFLVQTGLDGRLLETAGGTRGGAELAGLVEHALRLRNLFGFVPRKYNYALIEAMALAGALDPELSDRSEALNKAAAHLQMGDTEARWSAEIGEDGLVRFRRLWRGVTDVHEIEAAFLTSAEARKLHRVAGEHAEVYQSPVHLVKGSEDEPEPVDPDSADETDSDAPAIADDSAITLPSQLLDAVMAAGRKGQKVQRYKGLGEMNAEQLWETTLDPDNRALLQVKVEDADVTDEIFTRLMGDIVEPRREFIQDNALNVANLDV